MSKNNGIFNVEVSIDQQAINDKFWNKWTVGIEYDVAKLFVKTIDPWVPYDTGALSDPNNVSIVVSAANGCEVVYEKEYAAKQYYGTEFHHTIDHHPLATAYWDKVAMQTERESFAKGAEQIVKEHFKNGQK